MVCSTSSCSGWKWRSEDVSCRSVTVTLQEASGSPSRPRGDPAQPREIQPLRFQARPGEAGMVEGLSHCSSVPTLGSGGSPWAGVAQRRASPDSGVKSELHRSLLLALAYRPHPGLSLHHLRSEPSLATVLNHRPCSALGTSLTPLSTGEFLDSSLVLSAQTQFH